MNTLWSHRWAFAPVILLAGSIGFAAFTVRLALRDHGTAAEPEYDRKARAWSEQRAARLAGEALRWTVSPSLVRGSPAELELELEVSDKYGLPIDGAVASVEGIPIRAADEASTRPLTETKPGRYRGTLPVRTSGQWEFRVEIVRGNDRLLETFRRMVAPWPDAAGGPR